MTIHVSRCHVFLATLGDTFCSTGAVVTAFSQSIGVVDAIFLHEFKRWGDDEPVASDQGPWKAVRITHTTYLRSRGRESQYRKSSFQLLFVNIRGHGSGWCALGCDRSAAPSELTDSTHPSCRLLRRKGTKLRKKDRDTRNHSQRHRQLALRGRRRRKQAPVRFII